MERFDIETYKQNALISVTKEVREAVARSDVKEGVAVVYSPHTTAGMTINENADPDVVRDLLAALEAGVPDVRFRHGEGNSPAHFKTLMTGASVTVPISQGKLCLGTWQDIYFCEFDGPRQRKFLVQILAEA